MSEKNLCPAYGSSEIGKGKQIAHGRMIPVNKIFTAGSNVLADICTSCGNILSLKVEEPERFKL
ncbi:hypothetical protein CBU02nite_36550 [Clostridium butyricum]|uniref:Transcription initiation factor TFIIIB n=1 Tax=Clostridium butyricum TaxID=1492 RepID=A0A512TSC9_CLOBU|nr:transcription initiation factor TFIIIB [Clostridium butyricum]NOW24867.1 hypothetical protein [Clostridium butyricum]GEQ23149.1 hypothetical protein CBU02nite_36550 [Clostridium butyricum]